MQTVLERNAGADSRSSLCLKRQKRSMNHRTRCNRSVDERRETKSEAEYYKRLDKVFEKEVVLEVTQQVEMFAFVDVAKLFRNGCQKRSARRQELGKIYQRATFHWRRLTAATQVTAEGICLRNMSKVAWRRFVTRLQPILHQTRCKTWPLFMLGTSNYYFKVKFHGQEIRLNCSNGYDDFHIGKTTSRTRGLDFANRTLTHRNLAISYRCIAQISRFGKWHLNWPLDKNVFPRSGRSRYI